jgi:flagellar biogenesis protein FliO
MSHLLLSLALLAAPGTPSGGPGIDPLPPAVFASVVKPDDPGAQAAVAPATPATPPTAVQLAPAAPPAPRPLPAPVQEVPRVVTSSGSPSLISVLPVVSALAALAGIALFVSRRRPRPGQRRVEILETASLGPKRQLVLARMGGQLLLLGSSEAGVSLLSTQPAADEAADAIPEPVAQPVAEPTPSGMQAMWSRFRTAPDAPARSFDDLLAETADDLELRRKLASGRPGRVA